MIERSRGRLGTIATYVRSRTMMDVRESKRRLRYNILEVLVSKTVKNKFKKNPKRVEYFHRASGRRRIAAQSDLFDIPFRIPIAAMQIR